MTMAYGMPLWSRSSNGEVDRIEQLGSHKDSAKGLVGEGVAGRRFVTSVLGWGSMTWGKLLACLIELGAS